MGRAVQIMELLEYLGKQLIISLALVSLKGYDEDEL